MKHKWIQSRVLSFTADFLLIEVEAGFSCTGFVRHKRFCALSHGSTVARRRQDLRAEIVESFIFIPFLTVSQ